MATETLEQGVDQMFAGDKQSVEKVSAELAEHIALEDESLSAMDKELKGRKARLDEAKEKLAEILMQAGLDSIKLQSGLSPSVKINRKIYKAAGINDDQLFGWLKDNQLGDIIKPHVHFQTLQSTLRVFEENGNALPGEMFNVVDQKTVRMNGKSKFLASRFSK